MAVSASFIDPQRSRGGVLRAPLDFSMALCRSLHTSAKNRDGLLKLSVGSIFGRLYTCFAARSKERITRSQPSLRPKGRVTKPEFFCCLIVFGLLLRPFMSTSDMRTHFLRAPG